MKRTVLHIIVIAVLSTLWYLTFDLEADGNQKVMLMLKQEMIYQSQGKELKMVIRLIGHFLTILTRCRPSLKGSWQILVQKIAGWISVRVRDKAILDYFNPGYKPLQMTGWENHDNKAQAVAISIEDRRTARWNRTLKVLVPGECNIFLVKRLPFRRIELFQLITDVIGGFGHRQPFSIHGEGSCTSRSDGVFHVVLQDVHSENGANQPMIQGRHI